MALCSMSVWLLLSCFAEVKWALETGVFTTGKMFFFVCLMKALPLSQVQLHFVHSKVSLGIFLGMYKMDGENDVF